MNTVFQQPARELGATVCRRFISECFARFGQQIAKAVTGQLKHDELLGAIDAGSAFEASVEGLSLPADAVESLETRCLRFLRSTEPEDEELKFRLTQGYYIAQLLELDFAQFNPIADEAFRGTIFYVDTNVLLARLLSGETATLFEEVIRISRRLGMDLRVTRATIDESRSVTIGRLDVLKEVVEKVPEPLARKTRDALLVAYMASRQDQPNLTPEEFVRQFDDIPSILREHGIALDDRDATTIVGGCDVTRECAIVNDAAKIGRGWGKSEAVQLHDVCHFLLVREERSHGKKAWFLTRDRTLSHAASKLSEGDLPFCFPLVGFLQAICPFLESPSEQGSLVGLFSSVLEGDIHGLPSEALFDLQELKLIAELHEDVLSTPVDLLTLAFDYIKTHVLRGKPYEKADHPRVALALRKFLSSTADEKQKALQAETHRQHEIAATERARREAAEGDARDRQSRVEQLEADLRAAREREEGALSREYAGKRSQARLRIGLMVIGAFVAVGAWRFDAEIASQFIPTGGGFEQYRDILKLAIRFCGSVIFVFTSLPAIFQLRPRFRIVLVTVIAAIALGGLDLFDQQQVSAWADYLGIAAPITVAIMVIVDWCKQAKGREP